MAERTQFEPGFEVPNDGIYVEVGEHPDSGNLKDPKRIHLKRGESFPMTSNGNRKWKREKREHLQ